MLQLVLNRTGEVPAHEKLVINIFVDNGQFRNYANLIYDPPYSLTFREDRVDGIG